MGKTKTPTEIASMARAYTDTVLKAFAGIVMREDAPPASRIAAGLALLDRGWGKPTQKIDLDEKRPLRVIEIINDIVDPPFYDDDGNVIAPSPQERAPALSAPGPEFESEPEDEPEAQR